MANIPTDITPLLQIIDPATGTLTKDGLQKLNAIMRALRDHEARLKDLE